MSGSRTALVSLAISLSLKYISEINSVAKFKNLIAWLFALTMAAIVYIHLQQSQINIEDSRLTNMLTARIRLEKYFTFITNMDSSYLLPDFQNQRVEIVSESGYFYIINNLGIALTATLVALTTPTIRTPAKKTTISKKIFNTIFIYYLIALCFENVTMSFPNNQLLFIAAGFFFGNEHTYKPSPSKAVDIKIG